MLRKIAVCMVVASVVSLLVSGSCVYAQKPSFKGVKLTVAYEGGCLHTEAVLQYLQEWERLTGAKVERAGTPVVELVEKTALELASHSGVFDIIFLYTSAVSGIQDYLLDLTGKVPKPERFVGWRLAEMMFDGKIKGIPHCLDTCLLFFNKDVAKAAGLGEELSPRTMDDFFTILDQIQSILPYQECKYGFARAPDWLFRGALFNLYSGKTIMEFDEKKGLWNPVWNCAAGREALQAVIRFGKYAPPDYVSITPTEDRALFTRGEVAMVDEWPDVWVKFNDPKVSKIAGRIGTFVWPKARYLTKLGGGWNVLVVADVKSKPAPCEEAAVHLANWLTTPEMSQKMVINCGACSPQPAAIQELTRTADSYNAAYYATLSEAVYRCGYSEEMVPTGPNVYQEPLNREVFSAVTGEKDVEEALADAEAEAIQNLKDWGYYE